MIPAIFFRFGCAMPWFWVKDDAHPATVRGASLAWKLRQPCRTFRVLGQKSAEMPQGEIDLMKI